MKFEKKSSKLNKPNDFESPDDKPKSLTLKEKKEANSQSKSKNKKEKKEKLSSAMTEEVDFSKRDFELQDFLTGNLNKILYNRNKIKRDSNLKFEENENQILSLKDFGVVKNKLNKISNDESLIISENSRFNNNNNNLSFVKKKNSKTFSFNAMPIRFDKSLSFENNTNLSSFKNKSKMNLMFKNEFESFPKINNFIGSTENRKEEELNEKNDFQIEKTSSNFSWNENALKSSSNKIQNSNINSNNKNKFEKRTLSCKLSSTNNKGETPDLNLHENDDLKRLKIFDSHQSQDSPNEKFHDFGVNEKKIDNENPVMPINIVNKKGKFILSLKIIIYIKKDSSTSFQSPDKRKVIRRYSQSFHALKKHSDNNASYKKEFLMSSPKNCNEMVIHSTKKIRTLSHSKSLAVKNKIFDFASNKPSVNFKNSARALNDPNAFNAKFDNVNNNNNGILSAKANPSFKSIADFMQFNKKAQIKSSKSILNSGNIKRLIPPQTNESPTAQIFNSDLSDISESEKERYRKLTHRNKIIDSHSDNEDKIIQNEQYTAEGFVFDLNSTFISYWDSLITLITLYTLTYSPYKMAFPEVTNDLIEIIECFMDFIFIMDIIFQFFIPFYNYEEELIKSKYSIAINYLSGWFFIDLIASIPGSIITYFLVGINPQEDLTSLKIMSSSSFDNINKLTRLTKIYRVLKITKLSKVLKMSGDSSKKKRSNKLIVKEDIGLSSSVKRILNFLFVFVFASHMITCIWIFIGTLDYPNWLVKAKLTESSNFAVYISSLYFHWTTIFTIGYGDILSANTTERFYNIFLMFVGVLIYSFAVSALGTILSTDDKSAERFLKNIDLLYEMRLRYNIPALFYEKVEKFLRYDFKNNKMEKFGFINDLPMRIKNELLLNMYRDVIKNFKFFKEKSIDFSTRVVFMMKPLRLSKNEYLLLEGEFVEEIVFVRSGHLTVNLGFKFNELKIMEIRPNEHFGDLLVLLNLPSPVGVKVASKFADLIIIRKEDMIELSNFYPECIQKIFWISSYNYYAMMSRIEKKKEKFKVEEEKTLKKQLLYENYLSLVEKKKRSNSVFVSEIKNGNANENKFKSLIHKNFGDSAVSGNKIQIKRCQTDYCLPFKESYSKNILEEKSLSLNNEGYFANNNTNKIEGIINNVNFGKNLDNSFNSVSHFDMKNNNCNKIQNKNNKAGENFLNFFKYKMQEKSNSNSNKHVNQNNKNINDEAKCIQMANLLSISPQSKLNKLSESKKHSNINLSNNNKANKMHYANHNENRDSSVLFDNNNKNDIIESLSLLKNNSDNHKNNQKAKIDKFDQIRENPENSYLGGRSISSNSKTNMLKKQSTLQLLNVNSSYNSLNYNKNLFLNCQRNRPIQYDEKKKPELDLNVKSPNNEKNDNLLAESNGNKKLINIDDFNYASKNNSIQNSIILKKRISEKTENKDLDFSYNNFKLNDQSSIIGINNCKFDYSTKNRKSLMLKDDFDFKIENGIEKLNININNIISNTNKNTNEALDNCIFKNTGILNRKNINDVSNIQTINILSNNNKNNKNSDENLNNINKNNNIKNNFNLENEAINSLNKINFTDLIHNIPQNIFQRNNSPGSNSNSNNNSHNNNLNLKNNNNNNLNLITLTTENSKFLINTKEINNNYNNNNNSPNTNLTINNSFNFLENLNKSSEETFNEKTKQDENKKLTNNTKKIVNPSANNIIFIDNLNINNNCNHIYESGGKKCGEAYCISNDSGSRKNCSRKEKKNKTLNNLFTFKSKLKYKEDEKNQKANKEENKINNYKKYEKNNFLLNPNNNNFNNDGSENKSLSIKNINNNNNFDFNNERIIKEKLEESKTRYKKYSINLDLCNGYKNSSLNKSSVDSFRKYSLKEKSMQMLNRLPKRNTSRSNFYNKKEQASKKNSSGEKSDLTYEKFLRTKKNQKSIKKILNDLSDNKSNKTTNKKSTRNISKSISSPPNNINNSNNNKDVKDSFIDNKNIEILKNILNYREKEFQLRHKLSLKRDFPNDSEKRFIRTKTVDFIGSHLIKTCEKANDKKTNGKRFKNLNKIEEEDFCAIFESRKKTKQNNFNLHNYKKKFIASDDNDYFSDLKPKDLNTDRGAKSNVKKINLNNNEIEYRRKTNSFKIIKTANKTKDKKLVKENSLMAKKGNLENLLIESESPNDSIEVENNKSVCKKLKSTNDKNNGYLSHLNNPNSELKRFLTLGIQQEYKLEAHKINKIIIKILENQNQNKQDFFALDKNKKYLKFKEYFVFNTNVINKVKKTKKQERKMDKIKIPFVEI